MELEKGNYKDTDSSPITPIVWRPPRDAMRADGSRITPSAAILYKFMTITKSFDAPNGTKLFIYRDAESETLNEAKQFVHSIRVYWSRERKKLLQRNTKIRDFKIWIESIEERTMQSGTKYFEVTLKRDTSMTKKVYSIFDSVINEGEI